MNFPKLSRYFVFAALLIAAACRHTEVTGVSVETVEMNAGSGLHDSVTAAMIAPFKDSLDRIMNEVLVESDQAMPKERDKTETLLGNFVADVVLKTANAYKAGSALPDSGKGPTLRANICLLNTGGLRSSLPKGKITRGNIYELMPFDNEIVIVTLDGKQTWQLLRYIAMTGGQPAAGIKMEINPDRTPGKVLINSMPFDSTKNYTVATSDYLANGGDKMEFFRKPVALQATGIKIRDALILYCIGEGKSGRQLHPMLDERISYAKK